MGQQVVKHILFHRPTPWHSELECSTKVYAKLFNERGWKVTYLQASINPFHRLLKKGYYSTWKKGNRLDEGVYVCGTMSIFPYIDRIPFLAKFTSKLRYRWSYPSIRRTVEGSGHGAPDIIWTTIPGSSELKAIFPKAKLAFHVVDKYSAFRGDAVRSLEQRDYTIADIDLVIGEALSEYLTEELHIPSNKVVNIGQGVHLGRFRKDLDIPKEYSGLSGPKAVWVGALHKIDRSLLKTVVEQMIQIGGDVFVIGKKEVWVDDKDWSYPNLTFLGSKRSAEVAPYLVHADIGLMLYDRSKKEVYEGQHPLKLYEYGAAGLAVLSTYHKEFDTLNPPVVAIEEEEDISVFFKSNLKEMEKWKDRMYVFAQQHSWDNCADKALAAMYV